MADFYIKRNDTSPAIERQLTDEDGNVIDVSGASVKFLMRSMDKTVKVNSSATVVDGANGDVKYEWSSDDTDTSGYFQAEWEVTYSDSTVETFPNDSFVEIEIRGDIA